MLKCKLEKKKERKKERSKPHDECKIGVYNNLKEGRNDLSLSKKLLKVLN